MIAKEKEFTFTYDHAQLHLNKNMWAHGGGAAGLARFADICGLRYSVVNGLYFFFQKVVNFITKTTRKKKSAKLTKFEISFNYSIFLFKAGVTGVKVRILQNIFF
jgi:hypothetical protein